MSIDLKDFQALQAKKATKEPEVVIRTVESSAIWQALQGWVDDQVKACEERKRDLLERYANGYIGSYEDMVRQKLLLDITHAEMLVYATVAEKMRQFHPTEP